MFVYSCKKYPENHTISLYTVNHRMHGTYVMEKFLVDEIDSTDLISPCVYKKSLKYTEDDGRYYFIFNYRSQLAGADGCSGGWLMPGDKKNDINISYGLDTTKRNFLTPIRGTESIWGIRKLTNKEFWIRQTINNHVQEIHLKKIHQL
jgi:hypothetical protein